MTAAIYGLTSAIKSAIQTGDDLAKFSAKTGLSAKAVSELAFAAKMADIDLAGLETGIKKMQVSISQLGSGSKQQAETFAALGLAFSDLRNLQPDKQLELIADQIAKLKDPADRTRAAVELFGKSGADLLPLFEQGAEGIRKLREQTPLVFSEDDLKRLSDADDAFKKMTASTDGLWAAMAVRLAPAITGIADTLTNLFNRDWSKSDLFILLTTPPPLWITRLAQFGMKSSEAPAVASSGPTGRVLPGLEGPPGFNPKSTDKPTRAELLELERFQNQATQMANDQAAAFNSIAPAMEENERALLRYFATVNEQNLQSTARVIDLGEAFKDTSTDISLYAEQAARNMQDSFAEFLFDPFDKGLRGMLASFVDTLRRMVANAAASHIFDALGGLKGNSNSFLSAIGGFFAGARAEGGLVSGGRPYLVGERGPEMFVPGMSGAIIPNGGGGLVYAPVTTVNVDSRADRSAVMQDVLAVMQENNKRMFETLADARSRGR